MSKQMTLSDVIGEINKYKWEVTFRQCRLHEDAGKWNVRANPLNCPSHKEAVSGTGPTMFKAAVQAWRKLQEKFDDD